ncbi:CrcB family protein [Halobacteria archaeon AArc-curdl1]|uniref:Fluoride-specific ion channel FluC n=1 Tax=Natronosalvus hydrolyticus TaxID=2979988 RepID=A0AAP3E646_9EURY|nr:CrcB family protein [Halobacteria archaeon AArc-curdl1]
MTTILGLEGVAVLVWLTLEAEPAHLVGTGGAIGAICRHLVYQRLAWETFPIATLTVNTVGSFVFAVVAFGDAGASAFHLIGIGACGAFTTFSSFSVETVQLWERGQRRRAAFNAGINLASALAGIAFAWLLTSGL